MRNINKWLVKGSIGHFSPSPPSPPSPQSRPKLAPPPYLLPVHGQGLGREQVRPKGDWKAAESQAKQHFAKRLSEPRKRAACLKKIPYLCPRTTHKTLKTHNHYGKNQTRTTRKHPWKDRQPGGLHLEGHPLPAHPACKSQESSHSPATGPAHALLHGLVSPAPAHARAARRLPGRGDTTKRFQRSHVLHHALCAERDGGGHQGELPKRIDLARLPDGSRESAGRTGRWKGGFHVEQPLRLRERLATGWPWYTNRRKMLSTRPSVPFAARDRRYWTIPRIGGRKTWPFTWASGIRRQE